MIKRNGFKILQLAGPINFKPYQNQCWLSVVCVLSFEALTFETLTFETPAFETQIYKLFSLLFEFANLSRSPITAQIKLNDGLSDGISNGLSDRLSNGVSNSP